MITKINYIYNLEVFIMLVYETDGKYYIIKKERDIDQGI